PHRGAFDLLAIDPEVLLLARGDRLDHVRTFFEHPPIGPYGGVPRGRARLVVDADAVVNLVLVLALGDEERAGNFSRVRRVRRQANAAGDAEERESRLSHVV